MKKEKQKSTSKKRKRSFLEKYNERSTKGNIQNTLLKGAVDTVAGSVIGTGIGAVAGDKAAFAGIALILAGHYLGDESGVLRLTGASTMAYGIGKAQVYKNNPEMKSVSKRMGGLKRDLLGAFFFKFKEEEKEMLEKKKTSMSNEEIHIEPIRFETENEQTEGSEITDLQGYRNFSDYESVNSSKTDENDDDDDFDQFYGDGYNGIDLTLI